ncbi:pentatricopeptide repeat-containing protein At4g16470 isoform X1 [Pyrus x bretschneideri]|uniref:pentatricopeptide repeat-containing protein At4g16470 isoform X1 n=1 Tax=Pyrus x bretschneideri TaxID=225117 RepID=UPI00203069F7|nr:pentatricopeptide repeat-containing protein At4g16470 isoform X1 [Pyrus x bretschneideri]XP_048446895.1 pentatricopeptide repeat-containing protein At4g16470 isoform X1 [Pyrus x bretschneideri]XP_048446896.1 pentatricopeptide repeat-containing protein At4g16470 isoform X1 [Pyrus x bretschneideri]XP_048446897.1 pentatricopeptide repeat-containing protein At4g16470 isoform X1 [Pyrus x bretschneideri]XP_048446898.1 pentatricopeptide repeat-containing protein At4g16470 isoform X1 [Pyrus x bretsc
MLGISGSRMKALLISSVPHISKTIPLSLASSSKSFSFSPPTLFQNPNILLPKPNIFLPKSSISSAQNIRCVQMDAESHQRFGEIHVIVGPMFAGKTTTLLRKVQSERGDGSFQVKPQKHIQLDKTLRGLCYSGRLAEAVALLCRTGLEFNPATYALLLQECIFRKEYKKGKRIHAHMIVVGFVLNEYLKTKLLILYAKSGDLRTAHILLDMLLEKSLVSWNSIIAGYVQKGLEDVGLSLYNKMRQRGLIPDQYTFASVFRACASLATLEHGKQAHGVMIKCQIGQNVVVSSALMDMYFKCSDISDGHRVFDTSQNRNAITWTALISGYGQHGRVVEVLHLFHRMKSEGFRPNYVTFISVLSACGHGALVDEAWEYFSSMTRDYGIRPRAQHYAALVDVLGRVGRLEEAYEFVSNSPYKEHSVIWGAFLWACRIHGDRDLLKLAAKKYFALEPENAGKYVVLSNAYATFGLWDNVAKVRDMMKESGIVKEPAYSKIEVQKEVHFFLMGDTYHKQSKQIYEMAKLVDFSLKGSALCFSVRGS